MLLQKHTNVVELIPAPRRAGPPAEPDAVPPGPVPSLGRPVAVAGFAVLTAVVVAVAWATSPTPPPPVTLAPPALVAPGYPTPEEPLMRAAFR